MCERWSLASPRPHSQLARGGVVALRAAEIREQQPGLCPGLCVSNLNRFPPSSRSAVLRGSPAGSAGQLGFGRAQGSGHLRGLCCGPWSSQGHCEGPGTLGGISAVHPPEFLQVMAGQSPSTRLALVSIWRRPEPLSPSRPLSDVSSVPPMPSAAHWAPAAPQHPGPGRGHLEPAPPVTWGKGGVQGPGQFRARPEHCF